MRFLEVHPGDDMLVMLEDHRRGEVVQVDGGSLELLDDIPAKQKFAVRDFQVGEQLKMYGIVVAEARHPIRAGQLIAT